MFKIGIVTEIDINKVMVRVTFPDLDNVVSYWFPVMQEKTLNDKFYCIPDLQEYVVCLVDENLESGVVIGAIYSDSDKAPEGLSENIFYKKFKDGTVIQFNRETQELEINISDGKYLKYDGSGTWHIQGDLVVSGNVYDLDGSKNHIDHIRDVYNGHTHPGDSGGSTGTPSQSL